MATSAWIESASRTEKPGRGGDGYSDHVLSLPAVTPDHEAQERDRATRFVLRQAGADAPQVLEVLGLTDPPPAPAKSSDTTTRHRPIARCPVCHRRRHIRVDGTLSRHKVRGHQCEGEGKQPLREGENT